MKLAVFNGGLDRRKSPRHIQPNEAVECSNVDITTQELASCKGLGTTLASGVRAPYYFEADVEWVDDADVRDYLEYKGKLYWSGSEGLHERKGGVDRVLGVESPNITDLKAYDIAGTYFDETNPALFNRPLPTHTVETTVINIGGVAVYTTPIVSWVGTTYTVHVQVWVDGEVFADLTHILQVNPDPAQLGTPLGFDLTGWATLTNPPPNAVIKVGLVVPAVGIVNLPNLIWDGVIPQTPELLLSMSDLSTSNKLPPYSDVPTDGINLNISFNFGVFVPEVNAAHPAGKIYRSISNTVNQNVIFNTEQAGQIGGNWVKWVGRPYIASGVLGDALLDEAEHRTYINDTNLSPAVIPPHNLSFKEVGGVWYCTKKRYDIIDVFELPNPRVAPYLTSIAQTFVEEPYTGTATYLYTYYNIVTGVESLPTPISNEVTIAATFNNPLLLIKVSPDITDSDIVIRIYRVGGATLSYTLVTEIPAKTTLWLDKYKNADMMGTLLPSDIGGSPPKELQFLTFSGGMFFGSLGDVLRFTDVFGNIEVWKETHYLDFEVPITALSDSTSGLVVFTRYKTYLVTGNSPATLSRQLLSGDQGCISAKTIVKRGNTLLFWSTDGVCALSGSSLVVVSKSKFGKLVYPNVKQSVLHDEVYYTTIGNTILALDLRFGTVFVEFSFNTTWLSVGIDKLFGVVEGNRKELFAGGLLPYTYKTGELTEGASSNIKLYSVIYVACSGTHTMEVYIDGVLVATRHLTGSKLPQEVKIPKTVQRGTSIAFKLSGVGTVKELEYKAEGRQNGR